jgi:hypothetical protein
LELVVRATGYQCGTARESRAAAAAPPSLPKRRPRIPLQPCLALLLQFTSTKDDSIQRIRATYQPIHSFTGRVSCLPWRVTSRRRGLYDAIFSFAFTGGLLAPGILGYIAQRFGVGMIMVLPMLGTFMVFVLFLLILLEAKLSGDLPTKLA